MKTKNYNLIPLSIENGLNAVQIGTAGGYIRLLDAPATANVEIHLNEKNADPIPLKVYHAIEATNIERIYVTCNAVAGGVIKIVQANTAADFRMITPASDVKLSTLGGYETTALEQLDKIINPYQKPISTNGGGELTTLTTVFSKTVTCDKIKVYFSGIRNDNAFFLSGSCQLFLNGNVILTGGGINDSAGRDSGNNNGEFFVNSGDLIEIKILTSASHYMFFNIEEYTLKP